MVPDSEFTQSAEFRSFADSGVALAGQREIRYFFFLRRAIGQHSRSSQQRAFGEKRPGLKVRAFQHVIRHNSERGSTLLEQPILEKR